MRVCEKCGKTENVVYWRGKIKRKTPITANIRTRDVCNECFSEVKKDNLERIEKGEEITSSLKTFKEKRQLNQFRRKINESKKK